MRSTLCRAAASPAATRIIWLPGAYNDAADFVREGFVSAVMRRSLALDLEIVDLELQYLGDRAALEELRSEVVVPLRAAGVTVWMAGISLGGLLALDFAASSERDLAGLCLLAPYPGNRMLLEEIAAARSLLDWQPGELAESDAERRIWRYLKGRGTDAAPLYLGFGKDDRFKTGLRLMQTAVGAASVHVTAGGHDWSTWVRLWENFLDSHRLGRNGYE